MGRILCGEKLGGTIATLVVVIAAASASAQLTPYSQDFEGLDRTNPDALSGDGWKLFASGINGDDTFGNFGVGPFPAPNNIAGPQSSVISDFASGGDPPAGDQGLVVFSDYNSDLHSNPLDPRTLIISIFQEQTIGPDDIGKKAVFNFLAEGNAFPPTGDAVAEAFILTLDPNAGFASTNNLSFDTTTVPDGDPTPGMLMLDLSDAALEGQILQFGFRNFAKDYEGSAVDYDNVSLTIIPEPASIMLISLAGLAVMRRRTAAK